MASISKNGTDDDGERLSAWNLETVKPDHALASYGDLYIVIWRVNTTMEGADALRNGCTRFAKSRPKGIGLITIVEENAPMPPSDARTEIAGFLRDASDQIRASAVVFEGSGFRAAAVRSVVVGLTMLARQRYPHKVFSNFREASSWLHSELGERLERPFAPFDLRNALSEIRAEIGSDGA